MNLVLLNRSFELPPDNWYHIMPLGNYPHPEGIVQVLDPSAALSMVNRFRRDAQTPNFPGLLVDYDHFSDDLDHPSEAAGWVQDLQNRTNGLWAQIRWSDTGEAAVKGGRYRLVSPVFARQDAEVIDAKQRRPVRLLKVALTNDPNLRGMVPLSNRAASPAADNQQPTETTRMTKLATLLGLSADASEDALHAEVTKLQNRAATAEQRAATLVAENKSLLEAQIEADLEKYKGRYKPEAKDKVKAQLLNNRAAAIEMLESIEETKPTVESVRAAANQSGNTLNRSQAQTPAAGTAKPNAHAALRSGVMEIKNRNGCSWDAAFTIARTERPELFAACVEK